MATTTMHFGPEWMRTKQPPTRTQPPPSPPPAVSVPLSSASTYSALVSPAPAPQPEKRDEAYPFRYSKEEMLAIYKDGGGRGGLGLEVERWKGIVREVGSEPIGLREMGDAEKKLFASPLNSDLRRRQSTDYLSPLSTQATGGERPRLNNPTASPMRERFGSLMRRKSTDQPPPAMTRKLSMPSGHGSLASPRDGGLPSPRTRIGPFDGVLNGGDSWVARRRASEGLQKAGARGESGDMEHKESEIKEEEEEEEEGCHSERQQANTQETHNNAREPPPELDHPQAIATAGPSKDSMQSDFNTGVEHISSSDGLPSGTRDDVNSAGPPPGIPDLASVEWSYLDPQGQVQGPFRADLMQKWYDDGYFTPDLMMKRTHLDTEWAAVGDLARHSGGNKIFLSLSMPPPAPPPGLSRQTEPPVLGFVTPVDQNTFNGPYQPAPIRSLRVSTLDSYLGVVSNPSDSPSSSFGGGGFGNSSPDLTALCGRVGSNSHPTDSPVGGRTAFPVVTEPSSAFRRNAFNEQSLDPSLTFRSSSFGNVAPGRSSTIDGYGVDGAYGAVQTPWPATSSNSVGPAFDGANGGRSSADMLPYPANFGPGSLSQATKFGSTRVPQDTSLQDHGPANLSLPVSEYDPPELGSQQDVTRLETDVKNSTSSSFNTYVNDLNHTSFGQGQQYSLPPVQYAPPQPHQSLSTPTGAFRHHDNGVTQKTIPQQTNQYPHYPSHSTTAQSPWNFQETATARLPGPFEVHHPTSTNTNTRRPASPSQPTAWGQTGQNSQPSSVAAEPSSWFTAQGVVEDSWKDTPGPSNLTFSNVGQHNQLQQVLGTSVDTPAVISDPSQQQPSTELVAAVSVTAAKPRRKSTAQTAFPSTPTAPPTTGTPVVKNPSPPASVQPKLTAWSTEDEAKTKPSGVALSLREIQEAEAKKSDARKAAERERERLVRAAAPAPTVNEESQAFTASWGLPTSQAGVARNNVQQKEPPAASSAMASAPPVWTNATKPLPTKKTMKEIQEEEERRKKIVPKETAAATARRAYVENTNKSTPSILAAGGAWTTVGPSGKNTAGVAAGTRSSLTSSAATVNISGAPNAARANGSTGPRSPAASAAKTSPRTDDYPVAPSHSFLKWLSDSLKGLNSSVNVEEIMSMLLSFPMDPDSSTAEIISEMIYANSTTLDGRRFASEFVSKRKMDAATRPKATGAAGSGTKPVSIADVVKAQPKPAQQEWGGFKVVNKKKKGGR